jgi:hypothetical protein
MITLLMAVGFVLPAWGDEPPGPLDGFRANYAALKAEGTFLYRAGSGDPAVIAEGRLWRGVELNEERKYRVIGRWGCDGSAEYYDFSSPEDVIEKGRRESSPADPTGLTRTLGYVPHTEAIFDGEVTVGHYLGERGMTFPGTVNAWVGNEPAMLYRGKGPFLWWTEYPFPHLITKKFPGVVPSRREALRGGHPVEVEVYRKNVTDGWAQLDVSYDPAIGYLPRHVRLTGLNNTQRTGFIKEMYLIDSIPIQGGGFLPIDYYVAYYSVDSFSSRYPDFNEATLLRPTSKLALGHFKLTDIRVRRQPVALAHLDGIKMVGAIGGNIPLSDSRPLTIDAVKTLGGEKLTVPMAALPSLDGADRGLPGTENRFFKFLIYLIFISLFLLCLFFFWRWRRLRAPVILILATACSCGCRKAPDRVPVNRFAAAFSEPEVLYDRPGSALPLTLILRNDGDDVRLFKVDGGCTCRRVDQSRLPAEIKSGQSISLRVEMEPNPQPTPQSFRFSLETDRGSVPVLIHLLAMARHQFDRA